MRFIDSYYVKFLVVLWSSSYMPTWRAGGRFNFDRDLHYFIMLIKGYENPLLCIYIYVDNEAKEHDT